MESTDHDETGQAFPWAGPGLIRFQFFMLPVSNLSPRDVSPRTGQDEWDAAKVSVFILQN